MPALRSRSVEVQFRGEEGASACGSGIRSRTSLVGERAETAELLAPALGDELPELVVVVGEEEERRRGGELLPHEEQRGFRREEQQRRRDRVTLARRCRGAAARRRAGCRPGRGSGCRRRRRSPVRPSPSCRAVCRSRARSALVEEPSLIASAMSVTLPVVVGVVVLARVGQEDAQLVVEVVRPDGVEPVAALRDRADRADARCARPRR